VRRKRFGLLLALVVSLVLGGGTAVAAPSTGEFAPLNLRGAQRDPILLVPGTTMEPDVNFDWNYERAFNRLGWRWCVPEEPPLKRYVFPR
jgi:hypothetical protein